MGEEVKKSRPAPDPDSAKFKLGQIAAKAYSDAMEAKARGEMVGWCASRRQPLQPEAEERGCAISAKAKVTPMISALMQEYPWPI